MKRIIEIKSTDLLSYGSELTEKIQSYITGTPMILNVGKAYTQRFQMSDSGQVLIHHTEKTVIVEKF